MRSVVLAALPGFTVRFEGRCAWMYLDNHKDSDGNSDPLVTTGTGNLIDSIAAAQTLPWTVGEGGPLATKQQIADEWLNVKSLTHLAPGGGGQFANYTGLRLSPEAIDALLDGKVEENETTLRPYFPGWDSFPADAQLGIHSMAWALGAAFARGFPKFTAAANRGDWADAAAECTITQNAPVKRNAANKQLFLNAARGHSASTLYWPGAPGAFPSLLTVGIVGLVGWGAWTLWKGAHA